MDAQEKPATFFSDIGHCARCEQDHVHVLFQKFMAHPISELDGSATWNYWGTCPVTNEPILMRCTPESE